MANHNGIWSATWDFPKKGKIDLPNDHSLNLFMNSCSKHKDHLKLNIPKPKTILGMSDNFLTLESVAYLAKKMLASE